MAENLYCKRCDQTKLRKEFRWNSKTGKRSPYCISCIADYKREKYATDPVTRQKAIDAAKKRAIEKADEVAAYQEIYRTKHRTKLNELAKVYRQENSDIIQEKDKLRNKDPERKKQIRKRYDERWATEPEFRERVRILSRKAGRVYYNKNQASLLEKAKRDREANPEFYRAKIRVSVSKWRIRHPERHRAIQARRAALRRGALERGFDDTKHYDAMEIWQQGLCYHCDKEYEAYHRDHLVPILYKKQPTGRHEAANLALTCQFCNNSKHAKLLWKEWIPNLGRKARLIIQRKPVVVISTFAASERGRVDARGVLPNLKTMYPKQMLIFDWEWIQRREAVENMLSARNGTAVVTAGRKTTVVEIDTDVAREFLERYHLQGFGRGSIYLGLVSNNELVAVSSWLENKGIIELNRMAFKGVVLGGFDKMLKAFQREFPNVPIASFADQRYATGNSYLDLGFEDAGETKTSVYYYVGPAGMFHRRLFTRGNIQKRFAVFDPDLTEWENARMNGYYRLFGLPQRRLILK